MAKHFNYELRAYSMETHTTEPLAEEDMRAHFSEASDKDYTNLRIVDNLPGARVAFSDEAETLAPVRRAKVNGVEVAIYEVIELVKVYASRDDEEVERLAFSPAEISDVEAFRGAM